MKKLYSLLLLAVTGTACQHHTPPVSIAAPVAAKVSVNRLPESKSIIVQPLPVLFTAADTLTRPMRALLQAYDLSPLWKNVEDGIAADPSFDGFFGSDHYRFGMVFNEVKRDPANPTCYLVRGKCCYHKSKNIRPFSGTLTIRQLADLSYPGFLRQRSIQFSEASDSLQGRTYTARAQLQLRETSQVNSGIFEGEVLLDFYVIPSQPIDYVYVFDHEGYDDKLPTRGGKLLLRGSRLNVTTGQVKSFLVAPNIAAIAPAIFKDFMLDERMGQINPKYAKLGWNTYWENDEWWADTPKPSLHM